MKKSKIFLLGLALMVMAACIFTLFACSGNGGGIGSSSETYYYYKNNVKDSEDWIKFEKDTWTDSSDMSGRLEMKNGKFTAYMDIFGEEEIFFFGTVKKGVMSWTLGVDSAFGYQYQDYYSDDCTVSKKDSTPYFENLKEDDDSDNQTPSGGNGGYEDDDSDNQTPGDDYDEDDNENYQKKLVSLIANGGTVSGGELEYYFTPGQKMTGLPTPTRSGYVFDGWVDATGKSYTSKSTMPDRYLELYANWSLEEKTYSDEYMSFANLVSGKKQNNSYYGDTQRVDTFLYIEFTSADFGGPSKIGDDKIDLRTSDEVLNYTLGAQYNLRWYYDSEYSRENGSQTFVLNYGSNINYVVISSEKVSRCYLIDIYVKHDYYVKKYESIHTLENEEMNSWYNTETGYYSDDWVPEGETISQNTATKQFKDFEFKEWLVYDKVNKEYIPFDFNTKIYENINLYQSYKPKTITTNLNGGSFSGTLKVTPYEKNQTVLTATKTGYDFIGWKLDSERYFADANGFSTGALMLSSNNYFTQLNADFVAKQYMRTEEGESISFTKTVPIISYTDSTQIYLNEVTYVPYGTYCCAPKKVPNTKNKMFKGWMEYDSFGKGNEVLTNFDKQITKAQVIHAKMDDYSGNIVRLNETEYYDHIVGSTMTYAIYLPTNEEYSLYVESNASYNTSFTIKKYGSELADKTLNVRKNYPISTTLQFSGNYYQGWVYFEISNISADFNITVKGATGIDNAEANEISKTKLVSYGDSITLSAKKEGYTLLGWYVGSSKVSNNSLDYTFTMGLNETTFTKVWKECDLTIEQNIAEAGSLSALSKTTAVGKEETLTATTNVGYTWLGWYDGETKVSEGTSLTYTFTMEEESKTYTAKWYKIELNRNDNNAGTISSLGGTYVVGDEEIVTATTNAGYTWLGWYDGETKVSEGTSLTYTFTMGEESKTYTAKWYKINLSRNDTSAGTISTLNGKYVVGDESTITATTNAGYTWLGWYDGETKVSEGTSLTYTFTMGTESKTYTAKWTYYTLSTEINLSGAGTYTQHSDYKVTVGEEVTLTATTNNGYTWLGWYDGETKVSEGTSLTYTFTMGEESKTYTAKWYKINLSRNDTLAGTISTLNGKYVVGDEATITATINAGYTWLGWYDGETKVSEGTSLTYTFTMGEESKTYTAKWTYYTISTETNLSGAGTYTRHSDYKVTVGEEVTLTATTNTGYTWLGWYDGEAKVSEGTSLTYTFTMGEESKTYTAKWTYYTISTETNLSGAGTYTQHSDYKVTVGEGVTLTATINTGYTWLGWYDGEIKVSEGTSLTYTFTMGEESKTYTAKWSKVEIEKNITEAGSIAMTKYDGSPTTVVVSFDLNGASGSITSQTITATQGLTYPTIPTRSGYVFAGWYSNSACSGEPFDFSSDVTGNVTLYAKWISHSGYGVLKAGNNGSMYLISNSSSPYRYYAFVPLVSETITIYTTGSSDTYGYLYNSSKSQLTYDDDDGSNNNFSISYAVTAGTLYYIRPCANGSSSFTATVYVDASTPSSGGKSSNYSYVVGDRAVLTATTNTGYTWLGWYDGETKVSEGTSLTYAFTMGEESKTYTAKWYKINISRNDTSAGTISTLNGKYVVGDEATITATTNAGYTWLGWYDGETKVSEGTSLTYTFTMGEESKTYTAKWMSCPVNLEKNVTEAGNVSGVETTMLGAETTIVAETNAGYTWLGWYDGETKVSEGTSLTYTFTMGEESKTYTAKWEQCTSHNFVSCVCTKCNLTVHNNIVGGVCEDCGVTAYTRDGSYIYFGTYPQSEVTDSALKSTLTGSAGALPTSSNSGNWTSYGYYISGSVSNFMWYIDKEYEGEKYRGVYFTSYRPSYTTNASSSSNSYQDNNGYSTGNVYWFKYEPIKWRILSEGSGKALILAELILDSQEFYPSSDSHTENGKTIYANNWEYSTIRKWLNETFYNVAFNDLQKALIVATELYNKTTAPNGSSNSYATCQNNTTDKVFLLSYKDMLNTSYGFSSSSSNYDTARRKQTSDYAQVQGAYTSTDSSYLGNGWWWLRSPYNYFSNCASRVSDDGNVDGYYSGNSTFYGVVPALTIML